MNTLQDFYKKLDPTDQFFTLPTDRIDGNHVIPGDQWQGMKDQENKYVGGKMSPNTRKYVESALMPSIKKENSR